MTDATGPAAPPGVLFRTALWAMFVLLAATTGQSVLLFVNSLRPNRPWPPEPGALQLGWLLGALATVAFLVVRRRARTRAPAPAAPPAAMSVSASMSTRQLWILLAAGIAVRVAVYFLIPTKPVSDFLQYDNLALGLAQHHRYDGLDLRLGTGAARVYHAGPTAFRMPGYPLLLALGYAVFGPSATAWWGDVLNGLLYVASAIALYTLVRPVLPRGWALALLWSYSFYPDLLFMGRLHGTDLPGAAFILVSLALAVSGLRHDRLRLAKLAGAGVAFGAAVHCRPYLLAVSPIWVALPWLAGPRGALAVRLRWCAGVAAGIALTLLPWVIRNQVVLGSPLTTGTCGWHFTAYVNNNARGWNVVNDRSDPALYGTDEVAMARIGRQRALQWIAANPSRFVERGRRRVHDTLATAGNWTWWVGYEPVGLDVSRIDRLAPATRQRLSTASHLGYGLLLGALLATLGALLPPRAARRLPASPPGRLAALLALPAAAVVATVAASAFVFEGQARYHLPMLPAVWLVLALGLAVLVTDPGSGAART